MAVCPVNTTTVESDRVLYRVTQLTRHKDTEKSKCILVATRAGLKASHEVYVTPFLEKGSKYLKR